MKKGLSLLLLSALFCTNVLAQAKQQVQTAEEIKTIAETALKKGEWVSITLIERDVTRGVEYGCDHPRTFTAKVTYVNDVALRVEDKHFVFGEIDSSVYFSNIASIKRLNNAAEQMKRAAQSTGFVTLIVASAPVFLGGMAVCAASNGKYARWACPR